jgi:hypothetical protein
MLNAVYRLGLHTGYYRRTERLPAATARWTPHPLFTPPPAEALLDSLGRAGRDAVMAEAEEVLAGRIRPFGGEPQQLRFDSRQTLLHWTEYAKNPSLLSAFDLPHEDVKFLWEPARFGFAFVLGRAYHLSADNRFAAGFWKLLEDFSEHHPAYFGPHWMNGQEAALRLIALVWAAHVFEAAPASSPDRLLRLTQLVAAHANRIPPTLAYARAQDNNHLVTESAALYTAGLYLAQPRWRSLGWRWLNQALQRQISGYGEYVQHSTNYHRLMLTAALWVHAVRRDEWPHATAQALQRAAHWMFSMLDPASGCTPNLGSNDGALILPLSTGSFADYRPVTQAAARAFLQSQMPAGPWDETAAWLGLPAAPKTYGPDHYLADNLRGRNSWGCLRATRFRSRLGHMDQLHLDLWWRGHNLACDAGTYLYNAAPPWDNALTTSRVHNTVTVDGRDPMTRGGRFLTLDWFPAYSRTSVERDESVLQQMHAYHNGYRRLGVRHERTVTVFADERWRVQDRLVNRRAVSRIYRLHWLLPDWEWSMDDDGPGLELRLKSPLGPVRLIIRCAASPDRWSASLVRAGESVHGVRESSPIEGWVSPTYGVKTPALSLAVEVQSAQTINLITEFVFPE